MPRSAFLLFLNCIPAATSNYLGLPQAGNPVLVKTFLANAHVERPDLGILAVPVRVDPAWLTTHTCA